MANFVAPLSVAVPASVSNNTRSVAERMNIAVYTDKSYVVTGSDTKIYMEQLKVLGCKYNPKLKCGPGWILSNSKYEEVLKYINNVYDKNRPLRVAEKLLLAHGSGAIRNKEDRRSETKKEEVIIEHKVAASEKLIELVRHEEPEVEVVLIELVRHEEEVPVVLIELVRHEEDSAQAEKEVPVVLIEQVRHEEPIPALVDLPEVKSPDIPIPAPPKVKKAKQPKVARPQGGRRRECCMHVKKDGTRCPTVPRGEKQYCGNHGRSKGMHGK